MDYFDYSEDTGDLFGQGSDSWEWDVEKFLERSQQQERQKLDGIYSGSVGSWIDATNCTRRRLPSLSRSWSGTATDSNNCTADSQASMVNGRS
jgi:hypothetical protein